MKLINQSFEIINQTDFSLEGIKKFIERCGRVCYKSEDRITDDSYEKFVDMLESKHHDRPLEFGTVHLEMPISKFQEWRDVLCISEMWNYQWISYKYVEDIAYITTNYRYFLDILKVYPEVREYFTDNDNKYYPKRYTVHFILSRGIMDEFRTHVGLSHLAESTRYCNYSKGKFGEELTFIQPCWCYADNKKDYLGCVKFDNYCKVAEDTYLHLLKEGRTPQEAREVLPLSIKSELISCGFSDAWNNFFYRRCANDAHPMAREIAIGLKNKFDEMLNQSIKKV